LRGEVSPSSGISPAFAQRGQPQTDQSAVIQVSRNKPFAGPVVSNLIGRGVWTRNTRGERLMADDPGRKFIGKIRATSAFAAQPAGADIVLKEQGAVFGCSKRPSRRASCPRDGAALRPRARFQEGLSAWRRGIIAIERLVCPRTRRCNASRHKFLDCSRTRRCSKTWALGLRQGGPLARNNSCIDCAWPRNPAVGRRLLGFILQLLDRWRDGG